MAVAENIFEGFSSSVIVSVYFCQPENECLNIALSFLKKNKKIYMSIVFI